MKGKPAIECKFTKENWRRLKQAVEYAWNGIDGCRGFKDIGFLRDYIREVDKERQKEKE